ncbi:MAG: hypothetical protein ACTSQJ_03750 [Promethearchaeota archaeon]
MTQKKAEVPPLENEPPKLKRSTRIENAPPDLYDPNKPRIGRRESEPHSAEITNIYDVLTNNFPTSRTVWDLHHYFVNHKGPLKGKKVDIQFDISFFKDFTIPHTLSSYDASKYEERVPDMTINILSKSTWRSDLSENVDICKNLEIKVYVVYSPFKVTSALYQPPFMRAYILREDGSYHQEDLYNVTLEEGKKINEKNIIDVSNLVPFRLGLMRINKYHEGELPLFRLIFIDPSEPKILQTRLESMEREKEKIEKEKEKIEQEKEKIEQEKEKIEQEKEKIEQEK